LTSKAFAFERFGVAKKSAVLFLLNYICDGRDVKAFAFVPFVADEARAKQEQKKSEQFPNIL